MAKTKFSGLQVGGPSTGVSSTDKVGDVLAVKKVAIGPATSTTIALPACDIVDINVITTEAFDSVNNLVVGTGGLYGAAVVNAAFGKTRFTAVVSAGNWDNIADGTSVAITMTPTSAASSTGAGYVVIEYIMQ